ncbi:hypothetical protein BH24ACI3_BH24ACI3_05810 [soil metagenome]
MPFTMKAVTVDKRAMELSNYEITVMYWKLQAKIV